MKRSELAAILRIMDPDTLYDALHNIKLFPPQIFSREKARPGTGPYGYRLINLDQAAVLCGWKNTLEPYGKYVSL